MDEVFEYDNSTARLKNRLSKAYRKLTDHLNRSSTPYNETLEDVRERIREVLIGLHANSQGRIKVISQATPWKPCKPPEDGATLEENGKVYQHTKKP